MESIFRTTLPLVHTSGCHWILRLTTSVYIHQTIHLPLTSMKKVALQNTLLIKEPVKMSLNHSMVMQAFVRMRESSCYATNIDLCANITVHLLQAELLLGVPAVLTQ